MSLVVFDVGSEANDVVLSDIDVGSGSGSTVVVVHGVVGGPRPVEGEDVDHVVCGGENVEEAKMKRQMKKLF